MWISQSADDTSLLLLTRQGFRGLVTMTLDLLKIDLMINRGHLLNMTNFSTKSEDCRPKRSIVIDRTKSGLRTGRRTDRHVQFPQFYEVGGGGGIQVRPWQLKYKKKLSYLEPHGLELNPLVSIVNKLNSYKSELQGQNRIIFLT